MANEVKPEETPIPEVAKPKPLLPNTVLVGKKPAMNYALATIIQFNQGAKEVIIKARGMAISKAVDTVEITRRRFDDTVKVREIKIGTEVLGEGENMRNVSTMEIIVFKS